MSLARWDYRCPTCGHVHEEDFRETMYYARCDACDERGMHKRVYTAPNIQPMMHEHWNHSVGRPISDMGQYKRVLRQTSDEHAQQLGMDVNYQAVEFGDKQSVGATGEGIYEANVKRSREGNPLLREIPGEV